MSTWWEKQEGLKELAKQFEETENEYIMEDMSERHSPKPPMSPFGDKRKESDGKKNEQS